MTTFLSCVFQWSVYFAGNNKTRTITKDEAVYKCLTHQYQDIENIIDKVKEMYDGKIISYNGRISVNSILDILTTGEKLKYLEFKTKVIYTNGGEKIKTVVSFRLRPGTVRRIFGKAKESTTDFGDLVPAFG